MQDENQTKVKNILLAISAYVKVKGIRGLAKYLAISEGTLYAWVKRGNIGDTGLILGKHPEVNPGWLISGEGPMLRYQPPPGDQIILGHRSPQYIEKEVPKTPPESSIDMPAMVKMTMEVLASETTYKSALASNIRAFHQAVTMEKDMQSVNEKLAKMERQTEEMAERMARMEELLLSLGASLPEKGEKKAL